MANFGMHMSDDQFKELCARLSFHNGHMTYIDFVDNFEDPRHSGKTNCNHNVVSGGSRISQRRGRQLP